MMSAKLLKSAADEEKGLTRVINHFLIASGCLRALACRHFEQSSGGVCCLGGVKSGYHPLCICFSPKELAPLEDQGLCSAFFQLG